MGGLKSWGFVAIFHVFNFVLAAAASADITYRDLYTLGVPGGSGTFSLVGNQSGGQLVGYGGSSTQSGLHPFYWSIANPSGVDLNPSSDFTESIATATNGVQQIGYGNGSSTGTQNHALLWSGSAASCVDLHPASGFTKTYGLGISATQQVGYGYPASGSSFHALLWTGTAASVVDLNPTAKGFGTTYANSTNGTHQVGYGSGSATGYAYHALLWSGTAASVIDLNPNSQFSYSEADGVGGNQEVGYGRGDAVTNYNNHALLWSGTAASGVDLNPTGFQYSYAYGTDGIHQVGVGGGNATNFNGHALLWSGNASGYVDLGALLPATFPVSFASSISDNVVYGYAMDANQNYHAIAWTLPEPSILLPAVAGMIVLRRR